MKDVLGRGGGGEVEKISVPGTRVDVGWLTLVLLTLERGLREEVTVFVHKKNEKCWLAKHSKVYTEARLHTPLTQTRGFTQVLYGSEVRSGKSEGSGQQKEKGGLLCCVLAFEGRGTMGQGGGCEGVVRLKARQ